MSEKENIMEKEQPKRSFDFEQWLRHLINGQSTKHLGTGGLIVEADGTMCNDSFGAGGMIVGKIGTDSIVRWAPYPGVTYETVTHHLFKQTMIATVMLGIEEDHENPHSLRADRIMGCAITHDLSETQATDVNYHEKNASTSSRANNKRKDRIVHDSIVAGVRPEWRAYFPQPIDVNPAYSAIERSFWEAAEFVGYCLFMLEEVHLGKLHLDEHIILFHNDVTKYIERLKGVEEKFVSVREFLDLEIVPKWQELKPKVDKLKAKGG